MKSLLATTADIAALRAGRTQWRVPVVPQPPDGWSPLFVGRFNPAIEDKSGMMTDGPEIFGTYNEDWGAESPFAPGDRVPVLTTWAVDCMHDRTKPADLPRDRRNRLWTAFDGPKNSKFLGKSRPGRLMPPWLRERLPAIELTYVRVERVRETPAKDILAEGVVERSHTDQFGRQPVALHDKAAYWDLSSLWQSAWTARYGKKYPWASAWCWVLEFERTKE
jgi:hypothetical protein